MKVSEIRILFSITILSLRRNAGKKKPFFLCKTSAFFNNLLIINVLQNTHFCAIYEQGYTCFAMAQP